MKLLYKLGLGLVVAGFMCLLLTLQFGQFRLTSQIINQHIKPEHQTIIRQRATPMIGQLYTSNITFIQDFRGIIDTYNKELKARQQWNNVIYDNYTFPITKAASLGVLTTPKGAWLWFWLSIGLTTIGALLYILPELRMLPGIKNNDLFRNPATNRGWIGWAVGTFLILFYVILYFYPEYLTNWVLLVEPLKQAFSRSTDAASQWFLYGFLYTLVIWVMGVRMLIRYRHSRYQQARTWSVIFFQTAFAFIIPELLSLLKQPAQDLKNIWPLDYSFFFDYRINEKIQAGSLGIFMLVWGIGLTFVGVPIITYFYGKRWYCSWVCGCGGLAETLGDPYRQLSDKRLSAWKAERWIVHGILSFAIVMTLLVLYTYFTGQSKVLGVVDTYSIRSTYGFWIGSLFSGVIGTGFYPIMGNRVWCRFGCPLAAYLGLVQRFKSQFRITTNGGQCISCGNCSAYCEMGIDVRWYAQRGQDIVRSSCVGCGICSAVCPRGVLNLETGKIDSHQLIDHRI